MINPNNAFFTATDVVDPASGKNEVMLPSQVVAMLDEQNLITTPFSANNLP